MNDFWITIISILVSFGIGVGTIVFLTRSIIFPYLKARRKGVLVRIHSKDGLSAKFYPATRGEHGLLEYKDGKEKRVITPANGSIVRCSRAYMLDAIEGETAPFVWNRVIPVSQMVTKTFKDAEGKEQTQEVEELAYAQFEGYGDNKAIANALDWALMRPKRKIAGLGLDTKTILFILLAIGGLIYLLFQMAGSAGGGAVI